ncbi:MAG: lipoate--protein ligase family protein [Galactobacter sp.]
MPTVLPPHLSRASLTLLEESASGDPAADLDRHVDLLREVGSGARGPLLRLYVPNPTLAFGRRDSRLPGFDQAWDSAAAAGFTPVVRSAGGRATAYHQGTLIVDQIQPDPEPMLTHQRRFELFGDLFANALRAVGVDAHVGEIPGEYCPGEFSVHGVGPNGARVKLVGTAQRVVAGAWLFSSVVVVRDAPPLRSVTAQVYRDLGMGLDPSTVGAAADMTNPRPSALSVADVAGAVVAAWEAAGYRFE